MTWPMSETLGFVRAHQRYAQHDKGVNVMIAPTLDPLRQGSSLITQV